MKTKSKRRSPVPPDGKKIRSGPETFEDEPTDFITVDLEVLSRHRLKSLATFLGEHMSLHHEGPRDRGLYLAALGCPAFSGNRRLRTADQQIAALVRIIRTFPPEVASQWTAARSRTLDVGVQSGLRPHAYQLSLSTKTLEAAVSINAKIVITVYAPVPTHKPSARK